MRRWRGRSDGPSADAASGRCSDAYADTRAHTDPSTCHATARAATNHPAAGPERNMHPRWLRAEQRLLRAPNRRLQRQHVELFAEPIRNVLVARGRAVLGLPWAAVLEGGRNMTILALLLMSVAVGAGEDDLVRSAIAAAQTTTPASLMRPYILGGSIVVETPFLRVALQARDAVDRYMPFSEADVDRSFLSPVVTITARDEKLSFKHLVICILPPGLPRPSPTARKKGENPWVAAAIERTRAKREHEHYDTTMTILQPTTIETTEHVWQNAYSATFETTGVKATFPLDALAAGRQIRAIQTDGSEIIVDLTPKTLAGLR